MKKYREDKTVMNVMFLILGCIVLVFEIADMISSVFHVHRSGGSVFVLFNDMSVFVTIFSLLAIFSEIIQKRRYVPLWIVSVGNIVCVNRLYSNQVWWSIWESLSLKSKEFFSEATVEKIFLIVILIGIVITMIAALYHDMIERKPTKVRKGFFEEKNTTNEKINNEVITNYGCRGRSVFRSAMLKLSVGWVIVAILYYFLNWTGIIDMEMPKGMKFVLYFGGIIAMVLMIVLELGEQEGRGDTDKVVSRLSLVITFVTVGVILYALIDGNEISLSEGTIKSGNTVVDELLDRAIDNSIVGVMVIVPVIFLIIHCMVKILVALALHYREDELRKVVSGKVRKIEKNLIIFVGNLFLNFTRLLLFIPDFFETIGKVLLGEKFWDDEKRASSKKNEKGYKEPGDE